MGTNMPRKLSLRRQRIASGETAHRESTRVALLNKWQAEGFDVSAYNKAAVLEVHDYGPQPKCDVTFVTSLSPKRIRRQMTCLRTWKHMGVTIKAVQQESEIETLAPLFPGVSFVSTDDLSEGKVRLRRLMREADRYPVIILNADLELYGPQDQFLHDWSQPGLSVGYRWNYSDIASASQEEWGIDIIKVQPGMHEHMKGDDICALGRPGWDWLVPSLMRERGYRYSTVNRPQFFHQAHDTTWSRQESTWIQAELSAMHGISVGEMRTVARSGREGGYASVVV